MNNFNRYKFFPINNNLNSKQVEPLISEFIVKKKEIDEFEIKDISSLETIKQNSIIFIGKDLEIKNFDQKNLIFITNNEFLFDNISLKNIFFVKDLDKSYNTLVNYMYLHEDRIEFIDEFDKINNSCISKYCKIDSSAKIGNNCVIGRGVEIGSNVIIKNNVVIKNSIIKNNVIISDNSTIGGTGFGFNLKNMGSTNVNPHIGIVYLDKNVNIGTNCTVDRAKLDVTYIGANSMLDNFVHIGHNVKLGENACIAAQSGISGSVKIGKNFLAGGQSGFAGHISIGDNVIVAAKSGVTKNIKSNSIIAGFPAIDIKEWKKNIIRNKKK